MKQHSNCFRHPIYPSFWAHPWNGCYEVDPGQDYEGFIKALPGWEKHSLQEALDQRWIVAVRWTGEKDVWLCHCSEHERSRETLTALARYLKNRYPRESSTGLDILPKKGDGFTGTLDSYIAEQERRKCNEEPPLPRLPGNPDMLTTELRKHFGRVGCRQPHDRCHHPGLPGYWLHPSDGKHLLGPEEHYSELCLRRPDLFGADLHRAFKDGWVSMRRWTRYLEEWVIRYDDLGKSVGLLRGWASSILRQYPEERLTPVRCLPSSQSKCAVGLLGNIADGTEERAYLPSNVFSPPELTQTSEEAVDWPPWPDYVPPRVEGHWPAVQDGFKPIRPASVRAGARPLKSLFREQLAEIERVRSERGIGVLYLLARRATLRSWVQQLETGDLPACVGDGYREWIAHLRQRSTETSTVDAT